MGNSGITLTDSTAPSAYNPSLLSLRTSSSVSLGGNTIAQMQSHSSISSQTGSAFAPSYLSSIQVFESYAHEFYVKNSIDWNILLESRDANALFLIDYRVREAQIGYSFAFPGFPMGFQIEATHESSYGNGKMDYSYGTKRTIQTNKIDSSVLYLRAGLSTILQYEGYGLGFNFKTRNVKLSEKENSNYTNYVYDSGPNTFTNEAGNIDFGFIGPVGHTLEIGHGFTSGIHQFITDTQMQESRALGHSYEWRQSYGYRLGVDEDHQFLCGLNHLINDKISYFGQDAYYSIGYSWKTRTNRSGIGAFFLNKKLTENTSVYGLTFSSEFLY